MQWLGTVFEWNCTKRAAFGESSLDYWNSKDSKTRYDLTKASKS
jgi:hypothetical protein